MRLTALARRQKAEAVEQRSFLNDSLFGEWLFPQAFSYGGASYPLGVNTSYGATKAMEVSSSLPSFSSALQRCPPAFAAQSVRASVLSQTRFTYRVLPSSGSTPRRQFGKNDPKGLPLLENPWPNGTTADLVSRMEWHAGLAGNAFVTNRTPGRLRVLRPDWVAIIYGSQMDPDLPSHALDAELLGYIYQNGGMGSGSKTEPIFLSVDEVAHFAPLPDPMQAGIGMSWITPAIREMQADVLATEHKVRYFENGATPNLIVKGLSAASKLQFDALVDMMEDRHSGVMNAYRTLYLTAGADATVVGSNLRDLDFAGTQGMGESRISQLSRVHPVILGASEGLKGAALNAGNFAMARRIWSDTWIYPTLQNLCASLAPMLAVPQGCELWFDTTDMPIMREDAQDAASIVSQNSATIVALVNGGFTPKSVTAAVIAQDMSLLVHSGMLSVQLQPPGDMFPGTPGAIVPIQPTPTPSATQPPPANGANQ